MELPVSFQYRIEDVSAIDAAPAFEPPVAAAFLKIEEVIPCHASLTPLTSHWDLLWFSARIKPSGQGKAC